MATYNPLIDFDDGTADQVQLLMKDENVVPFSRHSSSILPSDMDGYENNSVAFIDELLNERLNKMSSVYLDENGSPASYSYYSADDPVPPIHEHCPVVFIEPQMKLVRSCVNSWWRNLSSLEQDKLYIILLSGIAIWKCVIFSHESQQWSRRCNPPGPDSLHTSLSFYGTDSVKCSTNTDVLDVLARDRSAEEIRKSIMSIQRGFLLDQSLVQSWEQALISGMASGPGRVAVFMLLDSIIGLRHGFHTTLPFIAILNESSSVPDDISNTSPCSSPRTGSPRRSPSLQAAKGKKDGMEADNVQHMSENIYAFMETPKRISWPKDEQILDLKVASLDDRSGVPKCLIIVTVHPDDGASLEKTKKTFMIELIHILQFQNGIFGLLFSSKKVFLYKVKRDKANSDHIRIYHREYNLIEAHVGDEFTFSVVKFQKLAMDIFSCILHGLKYINS